MFLIGILQISIDITITNVEGNMFTKFPVYKIKFDCNLIIAHYWFYHQNVLLGASIVHTHQMQLIKNSISYIYLFNNKLMGFFYSFCSSEVDKLKNQLTTRNIESSDIGNNLLCQLLNDKNMPKEYVTAVMSSVLFGSIPTVRLLVFVVVSIWMIVLELKF